MKILYDHQIFGLQKVGGVSRYFYELFKGINSKNDISAQIALKYTNNEYLMQLKELALKETPNLENYLYKLKFPGRRIMYKVAGRIIPDFHKSKMNLNYARKVINEGNFDVFHPTYFNPFFIELLGNRPFVVTIYDCIDEIYTYKDSIVEQAIEWKKKLLHKARKIIAISNNTKKDIIRLYGIDDSRIDVIYLATSILDVPEQKPFTIIPEKYLLFVGDRKRYKNFTNLLLGLCKVFSRFTELKLVCTGYQFTYEELNAIKKLCLENKIVHIYVNDNQLKYLYKNAEAFIFPSLYEGFGIPILESFASGCPAIISKGSSMVEIGADAALYFDPKFPDSIAESIMCLLSDADLQKELIARGRNRMKLFSWSKTVNQTINVYQNALK